MWTRARSCWWLWIFPSHFPRLAPSFSICLFLSMYLSFSSSDYFLLPRCIKSPSGSISSLCYPVTALSRSSLINFTSAPSEGARGEKLYDFFSSFFFNLLSLVTMMSTARHCRPIIMPLPDSLYVEARRCTFAAALAFNSLSHLYLLPLILP